MSELSIDPRAPGAAHDQWHDLNTRGLQLAADGEWSAAADAFAACVQAVSDSRSADQHVADDDVDAPHLLALLLGNLAQAHFRAGHRDEGIARATEAIALRSALAGTDAITVARAQADLAVMMGSVGRLDDARTLLVQARSIIEQVGGDEDVRLTSVLENAARVELACGNVSGAEPLLLRLHALQQAHGLTTDVASALLQRVARVRNAGMVPLPPAEEPVDSNVVELELLDPPVADTRTAGESPSVAPVLDVVLELVEPADDADDDILGGVRFDLVEPSIPASVARIDEEELTDASYDVLGFAVEYGTPTEPTVPELGEILMPPPPTKRIPTPTHVSAIGLHMAHPHAGQPRDVRPATKTAPTLGAIGSATVSSTAATREALSADERTFGPQRTAPSDRVGKVRAGRATVPRSSSGLAAASAATAAAAAFIGKLIWSGN